MESNFFHFVDTSLSDEEYLAFQWTMVAFTALLIILRIYIRITSRRRISWSDGFVILAWLFFLNQAIIQTYNIVALTPQMSLFTSDEPWIANTKIVYASNISYYFCLYAIKASVLCFYTEFIPRVLRKSWCTIFVLGGLCAAIMLYMTLFFLFACRPISTNWSMGMDYCNPTNNLSFMISVIVFHLVTDIAIYALPLTCLRQMTLLPLRQKIGAGFMFAIGFLCILTAASVFGVGFVHLIGNWLFTLQTIEQSFALIVACCPAFKVLITRSLGPEFRKLWRGGKSTQMSSVVEGSAARRSLWGLGKRSQNSNDQEDDLSLEFELTEQITPPEKVA